MPGRGVTCLITDDRELRALNRRFLRKDFATDVLSFPSSIETPNGEAGEIAISLDRAAAQAAELGHSVEEELRILMLHGVLHLAGMDHETDSGEMARAEARWRKTVEASAGPDGAGGRMISAARDRWPASTPLVVTLVTCIQVLYLESLRIRARELPALEFFKETLEPKIGLTTERGALTFSLVKHIGLAVIGCLILAITIQGAPLGQALGVASVLAGALTIVGTYIVPQIIYRKTSGRGLLPLTPLFRAVALSALPLAWLLEFLQSLFELGAAEQRGRTAEPRRAHRSADHGGRRRGHHRGRRPRADPVRGGVRR